MLHALVLACAPFLQEAPLPSFQPLDVFELEWADDPQISPDGKRVVYVRSGFDVMTDRVRTSLWIVDVERAEGRPLVTGPSNVSSPRWSPAGDRLLYVSSEGERSAQIFCRWMDTGVTAALSHVTEAPGGLAWSPDGTRIAFTLFVPSQAEPMVEPPPKPEGAAWAEPPRVIERLRWRGDGEGLAEEGRRHVFVLPAEGGTPRQVTTGDFDHGEAPAWTADGRALIVAANRGEQAELRPLDTDLYRVDLETGALLQLTHRDGPDGSPAVSPDGRFVAYTGFDDRVQGYQVTRLYVLPLDGSPAPETRELAASLDRDAGAPRWSPDGRGVFFSFDDEGVGWVGFADLLGKVERVARDVGGTTLDRPYASGSFSVGAGGRVAFTLTQPTRPADVAVGVAGRAAPELRVLTRLNEDLLAQRALAPVEELRVASSADGRPIQAWIARPPGFKAGERYPLVLEIHGGPFANYGERFSADVQLYAAAGYVVVYANPRGSTSYGEEFGNLIHHAYPGQDYDDLMSVVDAALAQGSIDARNLFVTGGSGGGVLSAWIVGRTDRFRAAVVAKPVINWISFALTADAYPFFTRYWFPGPPWEHLEHYWKRSPLSLVGNVKTPTMLLTGEADLRTPISESEQLYQALKLREVPTALVRVPGASHEIAGRPSHLIAKVAHVLAWFERYRQR
jgi:dipeptidyl aminopeptidase/acylaminoacyl peptidase